MSESTQSQHFDLEGVYDEQIAPLMTVPPKGEAARICDRCRVEQHEDCARRGCGCDCPPKEASRG